MTSTKIKHGAIIAPLIDDPLSAEIELKFLVPPERFNAFKKKFLASKVDVQRLQSIYFDTADERLTKLGATIRLRKEGKKWVQTAKALTLDTLSRLEHNVDVTLPRGRRRPEIDLALHSGTPVGIAICAALSSTLVSGEFSPALVERFRVDVSRMKRTECVGDACVELALDLGRIYHGQKTTPLCEFEMELKSGSIGELFKLATTWQSAFGLWISIVSKAERGVRLIHNKLAGPPVVAVKPLIDPSGGELEFFVAILDCCLKQILGNANEAAAGALDEEIVHQLRVGLRRIRSILRELGTFSQNVDPAWETVFSQISKELGAHRDFATVIPTIRKEMNDAGIDYQWRSKKRSDNQHPEQLVRDKNFQQTLLAIMAFCHMPITANKHKKNITKQLKFGIVKRLSKLHALLLKDAKRFLLLSPDHQHRVRKRLKRMRYLSEFAGPLFDKKRVRHYLASWGDAQDALGQYNDYRMGMDFIEAETRVRQNAEPALFWLASRLKTCIKCSAKSLKKAARNPVFWNTLHAK